MVWFGLLAGALWGGFLAKRRKGNWLDVAQYAAGFAIAFGLVALVINIILLRMM